MFRADDAKDMPADFDANNVTKNDFIEKILKDVFGLEEEMS